MTISAGEVTCTSIWPIFGKLDSLIFNKNFKETKVYKWSTKMDINRTPRTSELGINRLGRGVILCFTLAICVYMSTVNLLLFMFYLLSPHSVLRFLLTASCLIFIRFQSKFLIESNIAEMDVQCIFMALLVPGVIRLWSVLTPQQKYHAK